MFLWFGLFIPINAQLQTTYLKELDKDDTSLKIKSFSFPDSTVSTRETPELYQFNITLAKPPISNIFNIPLEMAGLTFYKQRGLNQELNLKDYDFVNSTHALIKEKTVYYRPLNVVNSYAVYKTEETPINKKMYHIYTPLIIDAKNNMIYADMQITKTNLQIIIDPTFLLNAVYPVVIDPIFGYDTIGGTWTEGFPANYKVGTVHTLNERGHTYRMSIYLNGTTGNEDVKLGIYSDNSGVPDALQGETPEISNVGTTAQWHGINFTTPLNLASADYWLCVIFNGVVRLYYDAGAVDQSAYNVDTYSDGFADPFGAVADYPDSIMSIYANYTAGKNETKTFQESATITATMTRGIELGRGDSETAGTSTTFSYGLEVLRSYGETATLQTSMIDQKDAGLVMTETIFLTPTITATLYTSTEIAFSEIDIALGFGVLGFVFSIFAIIFVILRKD